MSTVDRDVFVLLMAATRVEKWAHVILLSLCASMLVTVVLWMRNLFGFAVVLAWGVALVALSRKGIGHAPRFLLSLLAIQVTLNSVYDIRVLFLIDRGQSVASMDASADRNATTFGRVGLIITVTALIACAVPAFRATRFASAPLGGE